MQHYIASRKDPPKSPAGRLSADGQKLADWYISGRRGPRPAIRGSDEYQEFVEDMATILMDALPESGVPASETPSMADEEMRDVPSEASKLLPQP